MTVSLEKASILAPAQVWILGEISVVQPLVGYGAQVQAFDTIEALYRDLAISRCDILLLDTTRFSEKIAKTVSRFGRRSDPLIVLLMADNSAEAALEGLWAGADACLLQRHGSDVLAATVFSLQRRQQRWQVAPLEVATSPEPNNDCWELQSNGWNLCTPGDHVVVLTESERAFLSLLFATPEETVTREQLISALTTKPWAFDPHRIEVLVHRLRKRVKATTSHTLPIRAVRGAGYRWNG